MASPYSISLLNDLHQHFPDLLYRPQRFQSVNDVLNYIISVANRNPYENARNQYEQRQVPNPPVQPPRSNPLRSQIIMSNIDASNDLYRLLNGSFPPIRNNLSFQNNAPPADDFVSTILRDMMVDNQGLQSFLQPVTIRPTPQQIEQGTILTRSLQQQEDNCAICQDPIDVEQMMRIMRHCTHRFHQTCVDTWLNSHVTCPTCRHDIREL